MVPSFDAVLFDFGHTLFDTIPPAEGLSSFALAGGRPIEVEEFSTAWRRIQERSRQPDELAKGRDLNAELHRRCWLELLAPLDELAPGLASFTYGLESSAAGWRPYPDARPVLEHLRDRKIPVAVVSDCGWDIRPLFGAHGLFELVESFVLSYEMHACKPDARLFLAGCSDLGVEPARTIMIGDNALTDGGAAAVGIATYVVPARDRTAHPALGPVITLVG